MRKIFLIGWVFFLVCGCAENKTKADQHFAIHDKYPASSLRQDYEQLIRILKKNHPALYDFTKEKEYESLISLQSKKITDLTICNFYNILAPLVAKIGCGHSRVYLPDWVWKDPAATFLPLDLFFQNKKAYIIKNYTGNKQLGAGTEILSINGTDISTLLQRIEECIPTDGNNSSNKREALNQSFTKLLATYDDFPRSYDIGLRHFEKDSIQKIRVSSVTTQNFFDAHSRSDSLLQFEIDSAGSTAIITIRSFAFYDRLNDFKIFVDNCFDQIRYDKIEHVVLDLRDNGGGDPFCASYLMTYLVKKQVPYFSEPYPNYTELAKPLPLSINHFSGELYTLINGNCFSTTGHLCALLRYHQAGEFIGTETGGTYTCNDNSQTFRLVNTGILIKVARSTFTVAVEGVPRFKGVIPDYFVERTLQDIIKGEDGVKKFALRKIEGSLK